MAYEITKNRLNSQSSIERGRIRAPPASAPRGRSRHTLAALARGRITATSANRGSRNDSSLVGCVRPRNQTNGYVTEACRNAFGGNRMSRKFMTSVHGDWEAALKNGNTGLPKASSRLKAQIPPNAAKPASPPPAKATRPRQRSVIAGHSASRLTAMAMAKTALVSFNPVAKPRKRPLSSNERVGHVPAARSAGTSTTSAARMKGLHKYSANVVPIYETYIDPVTPMTVTGIAHAQEAAARLSPTRRRVSTHSSRTWKPASTPLPIPAHTVGRGP